MKEPKVLQVQSGYLRWSVDPRREPSPEVDYGWHWYLNPRARAHCQGPTWRVSWIQNTGELYATDGERYIVFGVLPRTEVERVLQGWNDPRSAIYHNLAAVAARLGKRLLSEGDHE